MFYLHTNFFNMLIHKSNKNISNPKSLKNLTWATQQDFNSENIFKTIFFLVFLFCFLRQISFSCPGNHFADQVSLQLKRLAGLCLLRAGS